MTLKLNIQTLQYCFAIYAVFSSDENLKNISENFKNTFLLRKHIDIQSVTFDCLSDIIMIKNFVDSRDDLVDFDDVLNLPSNFISFIGDKVFHKEGNIIFYKKDVFPKEKEYLFEEQKEVVNQKCFTLLQEHGAIAIHHVV